MFKSLMTALAASAFTVLALTLVRRPQPFIPPAAQRDDFASMELRALAPGPPQTAPAEVSFDPSRVIDKLDFDETPLEGALDIWRLKTGCGLRVAWPSFPTDLTRETPITLHIANLPAGKALRAILRTASECLDFDYDGGTVTIATANDLSWMAQTTKVYDVRDLIIRYHHFELAFELPSLPETDEWWEYTHAGAALMDLITDHTDRDSWVNNGGTVGEISYWGGFIIVTQRPENHRKIQALFTTLRQE